MRHISQNRKALYRKFVKGSLCVLGIPLVIVALAIYKGASWWAGLVPGVPIYLILVGGVIYQFIKELRILKREEREAGMGENK